MIGVPQLERILIEYSSLTPVNIASVCHRDRPVTYSNQSPANSILEDCYTHPQSYWCRYGHLGRRQRELYGDRLRCVEIRVFDRYSGQLDLFSFLFHWIWHYVRPGNVAHSGAANEMPTKCHNSHNSNSNICIFRLPTICTTYDIFRHSLLSTSFVWLHTPAPCKSCECECIQCSFHD